MCKDGDSLHWHGAKCDDSSPTCWRWVITPGLTIQNAYTELHDDSENVAMIVRNSMAYPQTLRKKTPVVKAVVAIWVPEPPMWTWLMEALDEAQGLQMPKLSMKQRQEKLFEELDLSWLESWPPNLADSTQSLFAEYPNVFSLEPVNLAALIQPNM